MPDEAQATMMATAAMFTAGSIIAGASTTYGPLSARGYTKSGGENLDLATRALNEMVKDGNHEQFLIPAEHRAIHARNVNNLVPERVRLEQECQTVGGSLRNWYAAREFYNTTTTQHDQVKSLSQRSYAQHVMRKADEEMRSQGYYPPSGYPPSGYPPSGYPPSGYPQSGNTQYHEGNPYYPPYQSYSVYRQ